jgi:hypothetical protein|nr:MAG TPA: hypothetical protein [Caudoviricetes sp.]
MLPIFESIDGQSRIYVQKENYTPDKPYEEDQVYYIVYYPFIDEEYNFETLVSYGSKTDEEWLDEACLYNNLDKTVFVKIGESDE